MIIQKLAQRDGLKVTWFPTAEEAWPDLQERGADLLLLDVHLPGISGVELCRRLRDWPALARVPVVMFTPDQDVEKLAELRRRRRRLLRDQGPPVRTAPVAAKDSGTARYNK